MEWWNGISPETLAVVGAFMILREVFAFLRMRQLESARDQVAMTGDELVKTLGKINDNIEVNTQLVKGFVSEVKELRRDIDGLRRDIDAVSDGIKRRPSNH